MLEHNLYASAIEPHDARDRRVWKRSWMSLVQLKKLPLSVLSSSQCFLSFHFFLSCLWVCVCVFSTFVSMLFFVSRAHTSLVWQRNYRYFVCAVFSFLCSVCSRLSNFIENGSDKLFALDIFRLMDSLNAKFPTQRRVRWSRVEQEPTTQ